MYKRISFFLILWSVQLICYSQRQNGNWNFYNTSSNGQIGISFNSIKHISISDKNSVWASSNDGIYLFSNGKWEGAISGSMTKIWAEKDILWWGMPSTGLWSMETTPNLCCIKSYNPGTIGNSIGVYGFTLDQNNLPWIYQQSGQVKKWSGSYWITLLDLRSLRTDPSFLHFGLDNSIWIGTLGAGLVKYNDDEMVEFNSTSETSESYIPSLNLNCVETDSFGNLWIGTTDSGLIKFNGPDWVIFNTQNSGISSNNVTAVSIDANDVKWLGTRDGGLVRFDDDDWTIYMTDNYPILSNHIPAVDIDNLGLKWIAMADEGMASFNDVIADFDFTQDGNGNLFFQNLSTSLNGDIIEWTWSIAGNTTEQGVFSNISNPVLMIDSERSQSANVTLLVKDERKGYASFTKPVFIEIVTSTDKIKNGVEVFPNPVENLITVSGIKNYETSQTTIVDIMGKPIKLNMTYSTDGLIIDKSILSSGSYFIRLLDNGNSTIKKFIKL